MPTISGVAVNLTGAESVAGLLMVGTIAGVLLAMLMNNGGGAWDNAKKLKPAVAASKWPYLEPLEPKDFFGSQLDSLYV